jgi:hypothetical protein
MRIRQLLASRRAHASLLNAMIDRRALLAQSLGMFGVLLILVGLPLKLGWLAQSGIVCAVMGFCLFYLLRF